MPNNSAPQTAVAEDRDLRARLEKAEESLREILSGEADALFVSGAGGGQLFTLKGADQSYRTLIENMSEGALTLTPEGLILYANRRFAEILRTSLEKVIGSEIQSWIAPESRQVLQTLLGKDTVDNRGEELALAAADGRQVPVHLSVNRLLLDEMPDSFCMVATDLTAQKRSEAILAAENFAHEILEQAADAIVICDQTGQIIRASKQAQTLCGGNSLGRSFEDAFPLRQLNGAAFPPVGAIDTTRRQSVEARLERDRQGFDLLVSVGHLMRAENELIGSVVTLTDITERKGVEEANRLSQKRLRDLIDGLGPSMFVGLMTRRGIVIEANRPALEAAGLKPEDVLGKPFEETYWWAYSQEIQQQLREAVARAACGEASRYDVRVRVAENQFIDIDFSLQPVRDKTGEVVYLVASAIVITERKRAEMALRESDAEFRTLAESMPQIVWITRADGWNIYFNQQWMDYTGLSLEQSLGDGWNKPFHPEDQKGAWDAWQKATANAGIYSIESRLRRADGEYRWWLVRGVPLKDAAGQIVKWFGTCTDIHDLKMAELEIARSNVELRESAARIKRLNRVYAVLSGINTLIVRVRDRDELFREVCRIAVEAGAFRMAWIGVVEPETLQVRVLARSGDGADGYLQGIELSADAASPFGLGPTGSAIRANQPVWCQDFKNDPRTGPWQERGALFGWGASASLPLHQNGVPVGILTLYAADAGAFDGEEQKLLLELAGDISFALDHIEKAEKLDYLAYYDELTGLANRKLFLDRVTQHLRSAAAGGHKLAVFLIDLARFRDINDSLGRSAGDALLRQVAEWLKRDSGDPNLVARLDADHFATVLPVIAKEGGGARLLENTMQAFLEHPFRLNDAVFRISAKVGVAVFPDDGTDADTLFKHAEAALKNAKASGAHYLFYTKAMTEAVEGRLSLENQLREALDNEEFVLHYQPKVNLASGKMSSAEALIRWNDPRTGLVPPGRFIPILEETGLIDDVGRWALRQAIKDYLRWRAAGLPAVRIAVNVSPLQLRNRGFIDEIKKVIGIDAHASEGLELEITESLIMEDVKLSIASLQAIRALGVTIAIDDFGTGFSSLSYLARLPVDTLKIDRSFINEMTITPEGLGLVSTVISLAHSLKLKVVAEGVETEEQSRLLSLLRCDEMQGFLFSKPVPAEIFETKFLAPLSPG